MANYKIKLMNRISQEGLKRLPEDKYSVGTDITEPDGILVRSAHMKGQPLPESVLAIARAGAGVNNIPVDECTERGIPVFYTPGANANAVKEMVIASLYLSSRNIIEATEWVDTIANSGDEIPQLVESGKGQFVGAEVSGKTLGIIGLGAIGVLVANAAIHLGITVYGYDPYISVDNAWGLSRSVEHANSISEIYKNCDYITIHIPLTEATKNTINRDSIAQMKDGVRILNFARGGLVDSEDIAEAVASGKVACYITDFPDKHLIGKKGIISIPHLGASTPESEENCAKMAAQELSAYLEHGSIINAVNFPRCEITESHIGRVTLFNKNIPGMLSAVTTVASDCGYNIETLSSAANKGMSVSYTVLDLDKTPDDTFVQKLRELDGIFRVRVIF